MPGKNWLERCQPIQLYVVLFLTIAFFLTELVISHTTHALTLLMNSYHMLVNIMALSGGIITVKHGKTSGRESTETASASSSIGDVTTVEVCHDRATKPKASKTRAHQAKKLNNTFGWARIDVIGMLICCVFLASLSFSLLVEALQTLFHIDHQHEVHQPIMVLCIGATGMLLNGITYLLIGGYTFHQGSFLYVTESGDVVLDRVVTKDSIAKGERRLSRTRTIPHPNTRQRQGVREMLRDVLGCVFVMMCGLGTYFLDKDFTKFLDPILSIISAMSLMLLSYPYMKESGLILLQTIPNTMDIDSVKNQLIEHFPDIVNVHDLHIWQLTATKVISTAHIIFQNPKVYAKIMQDIKDFFMEQGITQVTIQPEFFSKSASIEDIASTNEVPTCLMKCLNPECVNNHCCPTENLQRSVWKSREVLVTASSLSLKASQTSINEESTEGNRSVEQLPTTAEETAQ